MKSRKKIPKKRKILDKKLIFFIGTIVVIAIGLLYYKASFQTPENKFSLKAAIIDQLAKENPADPSFKGNVTDLLENAGFNVTYYENDINVTFFKGLAKYNFGIIILRVHSALREDNSTVDLFTSEEFADSKYESDQKNGLLVKGEFLDAPGKYYFAITSKFIEKLEGYFPKSIVVAMGCWSLRPGCEQMANAFLRKGAKAYIGWTHVILAGDTDNETAKLLNMLLSQDRQIDYAVNQTRSYTYYDGNEIVTTHLDFYPKSAGNLRISELIKEVRTPTTLQSTVNNTKLLPLFCITNVINYRTLRRRICPS